MLAVIRIWPTLVRIALLAPLAAVAQVLGCLLQLLRWIRFGSIHGSGSGDGRVLRTPESRFEALDGYPFQAHYFEHAGARLHFVDEGPRDASEIVVCLHGEPTWSFLYRKVIPLLVARGYRVVAPDFLGVGKSDKPLDPAKYSFTGHVNSLQALFEHLQLQGVTLVIHDWGGVIGQGSLPLLDGLLRRLVILNTATGPRMMDFTGQLVFLIWQGFVRACGRHLPVGWIVKGGAGGCIPMSDAAAAGYDAPFPGPEYKAMPSTWPLLYHHGYSGVKALFESGTTWAGTNLKIPVLVAYSDDDPLWNGSSAYPVIASWLKNASTVDRCDIPNASHFLQEANPEAVASAIGAFIDGNQ